MICVSAGQIEYSRLADLLKEEYLVEIRLDLNDFTDDELISIFSSTPDTIATCRPGTFSEKERIDKLIKCISYGASYIDIEVEAGNNTLELISRSVQEYKSKLIISYHNHEMTPSISELRNLYKLCSVQNADIVKIACKTISARDNAALLSLYNEIPPGGTPLIAIGMGDIGKITRIAALSLGAPFTYASINKDMETAEGQIPKSKLDEIFSLIKNDN
jgi:3-dehydroquinate dehydratase-1